MRRWCSASLMRAARSSARASASISASRAAATRVPAGRCTIHIGMATRRAVRPPAARRWWRPARCRWRLAAIKADRSVCPPSFCGIYGMKPTHGLVPYTGIMPIELTLDHTGPMTATVEDNALLLEVLAGPDGLDPRQYGGQSQPYRDGAGAGGQGLRIGVVEEGFGHPHSQAQSDAVVREAADRLRGLGATVETVTIPMHRVGGAIWLPIAAEGATAQMMLGNGFGFNWQGQYVVSLLDAHSAWRERADELSDTLKNTMLLGQYMITHYRGRYYAKAQNLVHALKRAYDEALSRFDLLLMPTLPMTATPLPAADAPIPEIIQRAFEILPNTSPFDCSHHPAMSVPCGMVDSLPVGMMLVGKPYAETTIYRAAAAFERGVDWKTIKG